jgi:hypothetical protein
VSGSSFRLLHIVNTIILGLTVAIAGGRDTRNEALNASIGKIVRTIPAPRSAQYVIPSDEDLREWSHILRLFRNHSLDSCHLLLDHYNYSLSTVREPSGGAVYDIIAEREPVRRGWGTYIFNRQHSKRLVIQLNHPLDDPDVVPIGTQLFQRLGAEWLMIGGTSRYTLPGKITADMGRVRKSVFERWHEILTDLTHVTISLHSFNENRYEAPISLTDVVLSNGRTSDEQWGISQISMGLRDTLRAAGIMSGLAMYDSGYARLSGGWNTQGTFTNDSVGFGHWIYIELAGSLRSKPAEWTKFISAADRAFEITGRKIAQQANRAFGLVSPRVVKVDSLHGLFFPSPGADVYRIISFNAGGKRDDTTDVRLGNWLRFMNGGKTIASVTRLDSNEEAADRDLRKMGRRPRKLTRLIDDPISILPAKMNLPAGTSADSAAQDDSDPAVSEPLQVHRIPLQPLLVSSYSSKSGVNDVKFEWKGTIAKGFRPGIPIFEMSGYEQGNERLPDVPSFLIPIINNSYESDDGKFIGIHMTKILVSEIARLVNQYQVRKKDVGLIAERSLQGDYYLRIFPANSDDLHAAALPR